MRALLSSNKHRHVVRERRGGVFLSAMILPEVSAILASEFNVMNITNVQKLTGGFRCLNVSFEACGAKYFLKQYRETKNEHIKEVKRAEQWFAQQGVPIILPLTSTNRQTAFFCEGHWYSLFPFINGKQLSPRDLTPHHVASLGKMHATLHRLSSLIDEQTYAPFPFWDREAFLHDVDAIEACVEAEGVQSEDCRLALENIRRQAMFVREKDHQPSDFGLPFTHLLLDDFIYTNVFFHDEGSIFRVYDLERTGIGPRAYDLARSLFISCFDDGWDEKNFEFARIYLKAYQTLYPISQEEFTGGIRMYATRFMYMSWLEMAIIVKKSARHGALIRPANARLHHFLGDIDALAHRMFVK